MGLYIHIPYCEAKCHYCDFNSYAGREAEFERMARALHRDLDEATRRLPASFPRPLSTVFIGGGTPSVMPGPYVAGLLDLARERLGFAQGAEITSEANPGSLNERWLEALMASGLNRLSLGVQSLHDDELRLLGRVHTREAALDAVAIARRMGIASLSLDLIFGLPEQTLERWRDNLEDILALNPDHLSLYGLIVEEGTRFGHLRAQGRLAVPDDDVQADMYDLAHARLTAHGYARYEISNYARPGHRCRHNEVYWRNGPYLGVGPGAVSYVDGWRFTRILRPGAYVERIRLQQEPVVEAERLSPGAVLAETLILGLRTSDGVELDGLADRFSVDPCLLTEAVVALCDDFIEGGMLNLDGSRLYLRQHALMLSNTVMERILALPHDLTKRGAFVTFTQAVQKDRYSITSVVSSRRPHPSTVAMR